MGVELVIAIPEETSPKLQTSSEWVILNQVRRATPAKDNHEILNQHHRLIVNIRPTEEYELLADITYGSSR